MNVIIISYFIMYRKLNFTLLKVLYNSVIDIIIYISPIMNVAASNDLHNSLYLKKYIITEINTK